MKPYQNEKSSKKKQVEKIASVKYVNKIAIKPDDKVKVAVPDVASLSDKIISDKTEDGKKDDGKLKVKEKPVETGTGNTIATESEKKQPDFS